MKKNLLALAAALIAAALVLMPEPKRGAFAQENRGQVTETRPVATVVGLKCDATRGQVAMSLLDHHVYVCSATNTWTPVGTGLQGAISNAALGQTLVFDSTPQLVNAWPGLRLNGKKRSGPHGLRLAYLLS
jgi:hypothetical protein